MRTRLASVVLPPVLLALIVSSAARAESPAVKVQAPAARVASASEADAKVVAALAPHVRAKLAPSAAAVLRAATQDPAIDIGAAARTEVSKPGVSLDGMAIEDAVIILFALISEDARKDMRDMLKDMEATRLKRAALRKAQQCLKSELEALRENAQLKAAASCLLQQKGELTERETALLRQRLARLQAIEIAYAKLPKRVPPITQRRT
jgi:hypothetical protein